LITPNSGNQAISLNDFIESEKAEMTADKLRDLSRFTTQLCSKLKTEQARSHHDLHECTTVLAALLESEEIQSCEDPLPNHLAEAGVAAGYLLKGVDMIPDWVPEIGLTDDARVVALVFDRNPELARLRSEKFPAAESR
jgi:uncharacterized membrane protein YkvA (DUF1232 family)